MKPVPLGLPRPAQNFGPPQAPVAKLPRRSWSEQLAIGARENPRAPLAGVAGLLLCVAWGIVGEPVRARGLFAGDAGGQVVLEVGGAKHEYPVASFGLELEREQGAPRVLVVIDGADRPGGSPEAEPIADLLLHARGEPAASTASAKTFDGKLITGQQLRVRVVNHSYGEHLEDGSFVALPPGGARRHVVGGTLVFRTVKRAGSGRFEGLEREEISGTLELQVTPAGTDLTPGDFDADVDGHAMGTYRGATETIRGTFTGEVEVLSALDLAPPPGGDEPDLPDHGDDDEGD